MKKVIIIAGGLFIFVSLGYFVWQSSNKQNGNNGISQKQGVLDFERPEEKADISGIVKTVIGNEVTILRIERPEISNDNKNVASKKDESAKEEKSGSGGGMGGGGMGGRLNTDEEDDEGIERLKSINVGEEKIIIPVGIKMLKSEDGEATVATLDNIKKDQMLMIWTDETITDRTVATFVIIK